jgi:hypothetical protein
MTDRSMEHSTMLADSVTADCVDDALGGAMEQARAAITAATARR